MEEEGEKPFGSHLSQHAGLNVERLGRLVLRNQRDGGGISRGFTGCLETCEDKRPSAWRQHLDHSFCPRCVLTLDGRGTNDERLLEGFSLRAELGGSGLQRDPLLSQARDVDGGLLVQGRLVVQQWDAAAERQ